MAAGLSSQNNRGRDVGQQSGKHFKEQKEQQPSALLPESCLPAQFPLSFLIVSLFAYIYLIDRTALPLPRSHLPFLLPFLLCTRPAPSILSSSRRPLPHLSAFGTHNPAILPPQNFLPCPGLTSHPITQLPENQTENLAVAPCLPVPPLLHLAFLSFLHYFAQAADFLAFFFPSRLPSLSFLLHFAPAFFYSCPPQSYIPSPLPNIASCVFFCNHICNQPSSCCCVSQYSALVNGSSLAHAPLAPALDARRHCGRPHYRHHGSALPVRRGIRPTLAAAAQSRPGFGPCKHQQHLCVGLRQ